MANEAGREKSEFNDVHLFREGEGVRIPPHINGIGIHRGPILCFIVSLH